MRQRERGNIQQEIKTRKGQKKEEAQKGRWRPATESSGEIWETFIIFDVNYQAP